MEHLKCSMHFPCSAYCAWSWLFLFMIASSVSLLCSFSHSRMSNWNQMRQCWRDSFWTVERHNDWQIWLCGRKRNLNSLPDFSTVTPWKVHRTNKRRALGCCFTLNILFLEVHMHWEAHHFLVTSHCKSTLHEGVSSFNSKKNNSRKEVCGRGSNGNFQVTTKC